MQFVIYESAVCDLIDQLRNVPGSREGNNQLIFLPVVDDDVVEAVPALRRAVRRVQSEVLAKEIAHPPAVEFQDLADLAVWQRSSVRENESILLRVRKRSSNRKSRKHRKCNRKD